MSKIILQTMITNKLEQTRKLSYLGQRGIVAPGKKAIIVEGAYPTSCRNAQQRKCMEYEYENGMIDITIVSNLKIMEPIVAAGGVPVPEAIEEAAKEVGKHASAPNVVKGNSGKPVVSEPAKEDKKEKAPTTVVGSNNNAFAAGSIEDNMQDSVSVGAEGTVPEKMKDEAKDMFGATAVTEVSAEKPAEKAKVAPAPKQKVVNMDNAEAPKAEAPKESAPKAEDPKKETAPKAPAPSPASKKTATRRKPGNRAKTSSAK
jgi:hypothetical protein